MKPRSLFVILFVAFVLIVSVISPTGKASAQNDRSAVSVPTIKAPILTIDLIFPTYKWSVISGATNYRYQVWKGSVKKFERTVGTTGCTTTVCSDLPNQTANKLEFATYKWRVQAKVGGVWKAYSAYTYFTVSPGFNSQFNASSTGWASKGGTWLTNSTDYYTTGIDDSWSNAYRTFTTYTDFDYRARVKRAADETHSYGLLIRMGDAMGTKNYWRPGYIFTITNEGYYAIYRRVSSDDFPVTLQSGTFSAAIVPYDYNVLRVVAIGDTFHFYINGVLVKSVSDNNYSQGWVGFAMYKTSTDGDTFLVDWAKLTPLEANTRVTDVVSPEQQVLNEAANLAGSESSETGD